MVTTGNRVKVGGFAAAAAALWALPGASGCADRTNGGQLPPTPPASVRKGSFDNPTLGDPLSSSAEDLKGFAVEKKAKRGRR